MIDSRLRRRLNEVVARQRRALLLWDLAAAGAVGIAMAALLLVASLAWPGAVGDVAIVVLLLVVAAVGLALWFRHRSSVDDRHAAHLIERAYPDLDARLLAALDQEPDPATRRLGYLQETVVREVLQHGSRWGWPEAVPQKRLRRAGLAAASSLLVLAALVATMILTSPPASSDRAAPAEVGTEDVTTVTISPGDAEIEKDTGVLITARFPLAEVPLEASLVVRSSSGEEQRLPLQRSLDDPLFGARLPRVESDLDYRVEFDGTATREYRLRVFELPRLLRADATLDYPDYTGLGDRTIEDVRRVTAVVGTTVTLTCRLNKAVETAELVREGETIVLERVAGEAPLYRVRIPLERSARYELHLRDSAGRANERPPQFVLNATPNEEPSLRAVSARDARVSALEELSIGAQLWDDYGVSRFGIGYSLGGEPPADVVLGEGTGRKERRDVEHLLAMENLGAQPDDLLTYHFWAEDVDGSGEVRRVESDLYFAEVRPFEEIFRRGQDPAGGEQQQQEQQQQQQGQGQQAEELAELQKQIISATWKLLREKTGLESDDRLQEDLQVVRDAQADALEQAGQLGGEGEAAPEGAAQTVVESMQRALQQLEKAVEGPEVAPLRPALSAEQKAYQALLRLRAREQQVARANQQSSSGSAGGARSNAQLQQLELDGERNRYENQRTASQSEPVSPEQRENRQVLNRLRELAQRQGDLNERLKDLRSQLEAAETEEEREEIQRQLERLRDEEQEILRDTDELLERLDRPQNQERLAEASQRLSETRENVRRASEALQEGQVSQAVNEGTRAGRELENLRDDVRQATAEGFRGEVRELQDRARQLEERQGELAERLEEIDRTRQSEASDRREVGEGLENQERELRELLERMRETIESAELTEPLLSDELYEAFRSAETDNVDDSLEDAREMVERGLVRQARTAEEEARRGISELRESVDRAAEQVIGGEAEALERAREELSRLSEELERERARATGEDREAGEPGESEQLAQEGREGQPGQGQPGEGQPGEGREPGEGEPGEARQPGEGQPGEGRQPGQGERSPREGDPSEQVARGEQPGQEGQQGQGSQQGQGQPGQGEPGQPGQGQGGERERSPERGRGGLRGPRPEGGLRTNSGWGGGPGGGEAEWQGDPEEEREPVAPMTGEDFVEWSDRLRDVEEMIDDPDLRAEAARIRERARNLRREIKRHSREPNWDLVDELVADPLVELRERVSEELLRRRSKDALVPIDRDPVPKEFEEAVQRYYERLGESR